jgi:hypothetical protein
MTCFELRASLVELDEGGSVEQRAHLRNCTACSALVAELDQIAASAAELRSSAEPSPRVWNSIEIALRREGLIRFQGQNHSLLPAFSTSGWLRWMAPVAAILLVTAGIYLRQHSATEQVATVPHDSRTMQVDDAQLAGLNDDDLLQEVARQSPTLQAEYTDNLRRVNEYIQDAKNIVAANPNDEDARRSLMDAYQQKAMLFELALDRSMRIDR